MLHIPRNNSALEGNPGMKHILTALCLLAAALFVLSCGQQHTEADNEHAEHAEHSTATKDDGLVLNDGKKWQMDDHTRASFAKMAGSFVDIDAAALGSDGLKQAGSNLQEDLNSLIQGCTMTGPSHDQLHVFLMAYIPAVTALQESGQVEDAKKVQHYLAIYGNYFE